jgi:hypothetical protein
VVRAIEGWADEVVESCISAIEDLLSGLLASSHLTQQHTGISDNVTAWFDPDFEFGVGCISDFLDFVVKFMDIEYLIFLTIFDANTTTDVDVLDIFEFFGELEDIFGGFNEHIFVFEFEVRAYMLMQSYNLNIVFGSSSDGLI